jgi:hypothetical protein
VIYGPGDTVPTSGIYNVVNSFGAYMGRQVTCVKGEPFPPTNSGEAGFMLSIATQH